MITTDTATAAAVPRIRRLLCEAVHDGKHARTQRDKASHYSAAYAYASALRELAKEGRLPDGIAAPAVGLDVDGAIPAARDWLGHDADLLLGRKSTP